MSEILHRELLQIDHWIQSTQLSNAKSSLSKISARRKLPRAQLAEIARMAWRAGMADLAIRMLNPIVRPSARNPVEASESEKAEYAMALIKIGSIHSAHDILKKVDPSKYPRAILYKAFWHVHQWEYKQSIPLLEQFIENSPFPYERLVAGVNLAAALVAEQDHGKASALIETLSEQARQSERRLALGRLTELRAENFVSQRNWEAARSCLKEASKLLSGALPIEKLFVQKYAAITEYCSGASPLKVIHEVRELAVELSHWETVRDLDRVIAIHTKNSDLLNEVYFGTSSLNFRKSLVSEAAPDWKPASHYQWELGETHCDPITLNLVNGSVSTSSQTLVVGDLTHRALVAFCSDFYRPFTIALLHTLIYSNEHYHPVHSPVKVRQLIKRLRKWILNTKLPIEIIESEGYYKLHTTAPGVRITLNDSLLQETKVDQRVTKIQKAVAARPFSISKAASILKLSERATLRVINASIEGGLIKKVARGRSTRYQMI